MPDPRPHLRHPKYGSITQGTVFCCAHAARYSECDVAGLAITARCDVAQRKYPVLNYLPIVNIDDWLKRDGLDILVEQELNDQTGTLRSMLRAARVSPSLVQSVSLSQIAEVNFPEEGSKAALAAAARFREHIELQNEFEVLLRQNDPNCVFQWLRTNRPKLIHELIRRLSRHAVLGHYFLESLSLDERDPKGYVCLLREVVTLPRAVAEALGKGLSYCHYRQLCGAEELDRGLCMKNDELAMPVVEVGSPTIEHLLQAFATLFGRIGVADPIDDVINKIAERCLQNCEGAFE